MEQIINFQNSLFGEQLPSDLKGFISTAKSNFGDFTVAQNLLIAIILRPNFIKELIECLKTVDKEIVVNMLLQPNNSFQDHFLYIAAMEHGILTPQQVHDFMKNEPRYFIPEFSSNPAYVQEIKNIYRDSPASLPQSFEANNWAELKQQRLVHFGGPIAIAISKDDVESLKKLQLPKDGFLSMNIPWLPMSKFPPICYAAFCGSINCLKYLLEKKVNPKAEALNIRTPISMNAADFAIAGGSVEILTYLNQNGLDISSTAKTAALFHRQSILEVLLTQNVNQNTRTDTLLKCFYSAIRYNNIPAVQFLLGENCQVDVNTPQLTKDQKTALYIAAEKGYFELCKFLIEKGANVSMASDTPTHSTPFHAAILSGHFDIAEYLLSKGADINEGDLGSALGFAVVHMKMDAIEWLIQHNANINIPVKKLIATQTTSTRENVPPLQIAISFGQNANSIVKLLISKGANTLFDATTKKSIIHACVEYGNETLLHEIIDEKNVNQALSDGTTPLLIACQKNRENIAISLLDKGANPNTKNKKGDVPLHIAIKQKMEKVALKMIEKGADVEMCDKGALANTTGPTPLINAASNSLFEVVKALVEHGADVNKKSSSGRSPLESTNDQEIKNYLIEHGAA